MLTLPHPLRFPLAFDGRLLGAVLRIFIDTVAAWYRARLNDATSEEQGHLPRSALADH